MNWDQPVHSFNYPNGEPQTPTRTPTSPRFADTSFQTPKLESSFYDPRVTWNTADPYASSPEFLKTPQRFDTSHTANQWGQQGRVDRDVGVDGSSFRSPNPGSAVTAIMRSGKGASWTGDDDSRETDSAKRNAGSMQTPPPTSTSRRKVQEHDIEGAGEPSNESSRRLSTHNTGPGPLDTPSRVAGVSPRLLWGLQGSPDLFQVSSNGPSASPFFPQHRLFWDGDAEQQQDGNADTSDPYADPFAPNSRSNTDNNFPVGSPERPNEMPQLPLMQESLKAHHLDNTRLAPGSHATMTEHTFAGPFSTSPRVTSADDPSMFLSSPARRFGPPEPRAEAALPPRKSRQPYHYQIEESKREEELRRAKSQARSRGSFSWDDDELNAATIRGGRPTIRRSSTHSGSNPLSHGRQPRQSSFSGSVAPPPSGVKKTPTRGRISPLKARLHPTQRSFSVAPVQAPMQPVVLKIDKDGRAKTEMKSTQPPLGGMGIMDMDLDGSSTESDSNASDEYPVVAASRNTSFRFPEPSPQKPQYARSQSASRPHSKSSSYSSTATSHSGRHSPWADSSSRGRPPSQMVSRHENRVKTPRSGSFHPIREHMRGPSGGSSAGLPDVDEDSGDAQQALRLVMNARGRQPRHQASGYPPSTRGSSRSSGQMRSSPPSCRSQFDLQSDDATISPMTATDSDFATPSTTRQSNPSNGTRCICNSMDNGGHLMIQCESCTHWLHTKCVGLNRQNLPPVYVCLYCTQTPMRGGRIREPATSTQNIPSPLAHKSYRFR